MPPSLHRWGSRLGILLTLVLLASCSDTGSTPTELAELEGPELQSTMDIVDANHGSDLSVKNDHFFWLSPVVRKPKYSGKMLNGLKPVVTICDIDVDGSGNPVEMGDGCSPGEEPLVVFTRSVETPKSGKSGRSDKSLKSTKSNKDGVRLSKDKKYHVVWKTKEHKPISGRTYRVSVRIAESLILGYADVRIAKGKSWKSDKSGKSGKSGKSKKGLKNKATDDFVEFSEKGSLNLSFRIEEGALEEAVANAVPGTCDPDDPTVVDCDVVPATADPNGETDSGIVVIVDDDGDTNGNSEEETTSVVVIPAGTPVEDAAGDPYTGDFVIILEHVTEVDQDDDIPANSQVPFYAHITTDPAGLKIGGSSDPKVVICQDVDALSGYDHVYPGGANLGDLFIFRIPAGQDGIETGDPELIPTNIEPFECDPVTGTPGATAPSLMDRLLGGFGQVAQAFVPQTLHARRFTHGGLNTVMTAPRSFSNWGATLRFDHAASDFRVNPDPQDAGSPLTMEVDLNNLGAEAYIFDVIGFDDIDNDGVLEHGTDPAIPLVTTVTLVSAPAGSAHTGGTDLSGSFTETSPGRLMNTGFVPDAPGTYVFETTVNGDPIGGSPVSITVNGAILATVTIDGSPEGGVAISLLSGATTIASATSDSITGQATFAGLAAGAYTVTIDDSGYLPGTFTANSIPVAATGPGSPFPATFGGAAVPSGGAGFGAPPGSGFTITGPSGGSPDEIEALLEMTQDASGPGRPDSRCVIAEGALTCSGVTDGNGNLEFSPLLPGTYDVTAENAAVPNFYPTSMQIEVVVGPTTFVDSWTKGSMRVGSRDFSDDQSTGETVFVRGPLPSTDVQSVVLGAAPQAGVLPWEHVFGDLAPGDYEVTGTDNFGQPMWPATQTATVVASTLGGAVVKRNPEGTYRSRADEDGTTHYYELIPGSMLSPQVLSWVDARDHAAGLTHPGSGLPGRLLIVNSEAENQFMDALRAYDGSNTVGLEFPVEVAIGFADEDGDGIFTWVDGTDMAQVGGIDIGGGYSNFARKPLHSEDEPNGSGQFGFMWRGSWSFTTSPWDDLPGTRTDELWFVVEYEAPATGELTVSVQDPSSESGLYGVSVGISGPDGSNEGSTNGNTDEGGSVTFTDLPPGLYTVTATKEGYDIDPGFPAVVVAGEEATVPLIATPAVVFECATNPCTWDANGHTYEYVANPGGQLNWGAASAAAAARSTGGRPGHLVTITSQAESDFLAGLFAGRRVWIGLEDAARSSVNGSQDWQWVTGETFDFTNWSAGEPSTSFGLEYYAEAFGNGAWNDNRDGDTYRPAGYIVEYEPVVAGVVTDGVLSAGEWSDASTGTFQISDPNGGTATATVHWKNDHVNLYVALSVPIAGTGSNSYSIEFDDEASYGDPDDGDHFQFLRAASGGYSELYYDGVRTDRAPCPSTSGRCAWQDTNHPGGTDDGAAAFSNAGGQTVYEFSFPLNSDDDLNDFNLASGDELQMSGSLQLSNAGSITNNSMPSRTISIR